MTTTSRNIPPARRRNLSELLAETSIKLKLIHGHFTSRKGKLSIHLFTIGSPPPGPYYSPTALFYFFSVSLPSTEAKQDVPVL